MTPTLAKLAELPRLYLDCDGVLADFDGAFEKLFGHPSRSYEEQNGSDVFWEDIHARAPDFYRTLPLMPKARELFDAVKHLRPIILTGCPRGEWAELHKLQWAAEHFPGVPMVVCKSRNKRDYCQPGDILLDDWPKYRDFWEEAGGRFILFNGDVTKALADIANALPDLLRMAEASCPCLIADEPCSPSCTCRNPYSSLGCRCCARYGSEEQRKAVANRLVRAALAPQAAEGGKQ